MNTTPGFVRAGFVMLKCCHKAESTLRLQKNKVYDVQHCVHTVLIFISCLIKTNTGFNHLSLNNAAALHLKCVNIRAVPKSCQAVHFFLLHDWYHTSYPQLPRSSFGDSLALGCRSPRGIIVLGAANADRRKAFEVKQAYYLSTTIRYPLTHNALKDAASPSS